MILTHMSGTYQGQLIWGNNIFYKATSYSKVNHILYVFKPKNDEFIPHWIDNIQYIHFMKQSTT